MNEQLSVTDDMRVGCVGRTGTGKTFLMERLCKQLRNVIVIDSKHRVNWAGYSLTFAPDAALQKSVNKIILRIPEGDSIPNEWWTRAMRFLHSKGGGVIYLDEAPMLMSANSAPSGLKDVFRIGRELGVGVWWSAQEATGVYNTIIRQSDAIIMFHNHGASDRDKLIGVVGDMGEITKSLEQYEFVVYRIHGVYNVDELDCYKAVV